MKIRARKIAYRSKALDLVNNRIECISHVSNFNCRERIGYNSKGSNGIQDNKSDIDVSNHRYFRSVVSPCLCYFRSIPVQPSLDRFQVKNDESKNNIREILQTFFSNNLDSEYMHKIVRSTLQNDDYLIECGERLESQRHFYGANVIIVSTGTANQNKNQLPSSIPHQTDVPFNHNSCSFDMSSYRISSEVGALVGGRKSKRRQRDYRFATIRESNKNDAIVNSESSISHIVRMRSKPLKSRDTSSTNDFQEWLKNRKHQWNDHYLYRRSMDIVRQQTASVFELILPSTLATRKREITWSRDHHIKHDTCNYGEMISDNLGIYNVCPNGNQKNLSDFASTMKPYFNRINCVNKEPKLLSVTQDIRAFVIKPLLKPNISKKSSNLHTSTEILLSSKPPIYLYQDPPNPNDFKGQQSDNQRVSRIVCEKIPITNFSILLKRRRLIVRSPLSYSRDAIRYRSLGTIMNPQQMSGATFIPHLDRVQSTVASLNQSQMKPYGIDHFTKLFAVFQLLSPKLKKQCELPNTHLKINSNSFSDMIHSKICISITNEDGSHATRCYEYDERSQFMSIETIQNVSVGLRGEFLHLLNKTIEIENTIKENNEVVVSPSKSLVTTERNNHKYITNRLSEKRSRESSRESRSDKKKRKKKHKMKIRHSSKRKREDKDHGIEGIKAPVRSTPMIITHAKYEVTSIQHPTTSDYHNTTIYQCNSKAAPGMTIPSIQIDTTPILASPNSNNIASDALSDRKELIIRNRKGHKNEMTPQAIFETDSTEGQNEIPGNHIVSIRDKELYKDIDAPVTEEFTKTIETSQINPFNAGSDAGTDERMSHTNCRIESVRTSVFTNSDVEKTITHNNISDIKNINTESRKCEMNNAKDNYRVIDDVDSRIDNACNRPKDDETFFLICSENFLESWSEAASELSSGKWICHTSIDPSIEEHYNNKTGAKITIQDCILVDDCCVDIELPNCTSIKVIAISSWALEPKKFIKEFVELAACDRFKEIYLIFIIDSTEFINKSIIEIANLQNAIIRQRGCPCESLYIQYIQPRILSSTIATIAKQYLTRNSPYDFPFASDLLDKGRFLLSIIPTLTATECLKLLCKDKEIALNTLIRDVFDGQNNISKKSAQQLRIAVTTRLRSYPLP